MAIAALLSKDDNDHPFVPVRHTAGVDWAPFEIPFALAYGVIARPNRRCPQVGSKWCYIIRDGLNDLLRVYLRNLPL